jgi:hypothetical protein
VDEVGGLARKAIDSQLELARRQLDAGRFEDAVREAEQGLKLNPFGRLLVDVNVLFKLDSAGLRDKVTPLIGIEYAF